MHESVLLGVFGNEYQNHETFYGEIKGKARKHSQKPDEFYDDLIEKTPGLDRCDIFARKTRPGFSTWGNQATLFDNGPVPTMRNKVAAVAPAPLFDSVEAA